MYVESKKLRNKSQMRHNTFALLQRIQIFHGVSKKDKKEFLKRISYSYNIHLFNY